MTLTELLDEYGQLLHMPDRTPILAALATVAANRLPTGGRVWLLLVGPPSSGKTEIIDSLLHLPEARSLSTLTKASFVSGHAASRGGLLFTMFPDGDGLLLIKDFTSILSETTAARNELWAILREVYDGRFEKGFGNKPSVTPWIGQIGLISGVTEEIERHRQAISVMGDRFLYLPMSATEHDRDAIAHMAMTNAVDPQRVRNTLAEAVRAFFDRLPQATAREVCRDDQNWIMAAADVGSRARSPVLRHNRSGDIDLVPEPELPGRLVGQFTQLWRGLDIIGVDRAQGRGVIRASMLGGIPKTRRTVLLALMAAEGLVHTSQISARTRIPDPVAKAALEDLCALGMVDSDAGGGPMWAARMWEPTPATRTHWTEVNTAYPRA